MDLFVIPDFVYNKICTFTASTMSVFSKKGHSLTRGPTFLLAFGNSSSKWSEEMKTLYLRYVTNGWYLTDLYEAV
jgi:hypothetical protein